MTKKKTTLLSERVIRRWGKLAAMPALTENFLDTISEEDDLEDELAAAEDEMAAGGSEMEAGEEAEASAEEEEAVERIVSAVVDAISSETGVAIEVEGEAGDEAADDELDAGMDMADELDDDADAEMDLGDDAANRRAYNRRDIDEDKAFTAKKEKPGADMRKGAEKRGAEGTKKKTSGKGRGEKKGDDAYANNRKDETLNLDVIDDEELTEAVLKRVVERLLRRK